MFSHALQSTSATGVTEAAKRKTAEIVEILIFLELKQVIYWSQKPARTAKYMSTMYVIGNDT
jgi:hypothetical protein